MSTPIDPDAPYTASPENNVVHHQHNQQISVPSPSVSAPSHILRLFHSRDPLLPQHVADLARSGITEAQAIAAGIRSIPASDPSMAMRLLNWTSLNRRIVPALAFIFYTPGGTINESYGRLKPDTPRTDREGKTHKYESPYGTPNRVYFPYPYSHNKIDTCCPIIFTEGEKKALKAAIEFPDYLVIGLVGVWGWMKPRRRDGAGRGIGSMELIEELAAIGYDGRRVLFGFDSDSADNENVQLATRQFALTLHRQRSPGGIRIVQFQHGPQGEKVGIDDYLVRYSREAFLGMVEALPEWTPPPSAAAALSAASPAIAPAPQEGTPAPSNEKPNDPHRLARLFLEGFSHPDHCRLVYWRQEFHEWSGGSYSHRFYEDALKPRITVFCKEEFDRVNAAQIATWERADPEERDDMPPQTIPVTTSVVNNVLLAIKGMTNLPNSITRQPAWLGVNPVFPDLKAIVSTGEHLIYLPYLTNPDHSDRAVIDATPLFFSAVASDFHFEPSPPSPTRWFAFLSSIWPQDPESIATLQEWFGYLLTADTSLQKMLLIVGPPRSGKGTIREIIVRLIGQASVAAASLSDIGGRFSMQEWVNKSVIVFPDCRVSNRSDAAIISEKLLNISGEDPVSIDRKNIEPITAKLNARMVFFSNETPRLSDASSALANRFVLLQIGESFLGRERVGLVDELAQELPAIFWWAVRGWVSIRDRGRFTDPAASSDATEDMTEALSTIRAFVADKCIIGEGLSASCRELYDSWCTWCKDNGNSPGSTSHLSRVLKAAFTKIRTTRPRVRTEGGPLADQTDQNSDSNASDRIRNYLGIKLS